MATAFYSECIRKEMAARIEKNPRYSLRAFASALGINAGALSQILSGIRHPSYKMAKQILEGLQLSPEEQKKFLTSLERLQKARNLKRLSKAFQRNSLEILGTELATSRELSVDLFKVVADWYHYAILEMTFLPDFKPDSHWISKKIGISEIEAKFALDRLKDLELLTEDRGALKKSDDRITVGDKILTTSALRKRQKQVLEKSAYSLENHPIEKRNHSATTMAIDPKKIPEAKRKILEFSRELCLFLEDGNRTQVYEMQVSLFPLTNGEANESK